MNRVTHGTLYQRKVARGQYAFAGLLYVEDPSVFKEGVGYLLDMTEGSPILWPDKVLEVPEGDLGGYEAMGMGYILQSPCWRATAQPGYTLVRTMPMGRGDPGLVVYGANQLPLAASDHDNTLILTNGAGVTAMPAPRGKVVGSTMEQVLSDSLLFTQPDGTPVSVPSLPTRARQIFLEYRDKQLARINDEITEEEFEAWRHADETRYSLVGIGRQDKEYHHFLKEMSEAGALPDHHDYSTEAELTARQYARNSAIKKTMGDRSSSPSP